MFRLRWWLPWRRGQASIRADWCITGAETVSDWTLTGATASDWTLTGATVTNWTLTAEVICCGC